MNNKKWLLLLVFGLLLLSVMVCLSSIASADMKVSPASPIINGNNYVFLSYGNASLINGSIWINISDSDSAVQSTAESKS